jgi:tetratricopeptide (TPR) repeat protein
MATNKTCSVCKQPYPSDAPSCPHCAAAIEVLELAEPENPDHGLAAAPKRGEGDSDSAVDLGAALIVDGASGHLVAGDFEKAAQDSSIHWPSMVAADAAAAAASDDVKFDSPSDADLLDHGLDADVPTMVPPAPSTFPQLGRETMEAVDLGAPGGTDAPPSDLRLVTDALNEGPSSIRLGLEPQEESPSRLDPEVQGTDSSVNKSLSLASSEEDLSSGLDLNAAAPADEGSSLHMRKPGSTTSGIELDAVDIPEATSEITPSHGELHLIMDDGSQVNLGGKPKANGERPSGRDLIAEAVESGVDVAKSETKSSSDEFFVPEGKDGSDVDLGAAPRKGKVEVGSVSDLSLPEVPAAAAKKPITPESDLDLGSEKAARPQKAAALADEEEAAVAEEGEAEVTPAAKTKDRAGRKPFGPVTTGVAGAVAGGVACLALWAFGVEPPEALRIAGGPAPTKSSAEPPRRSEPANTAELDNLTKAKKDSDDKAAKLDDELKVAKKAADDAQAVARGAEDKLKAADDRAKTASKAADDALATTRDVQEKLKTSEDKAKTAAKTAEDAVAMARDAQTRLKAADDKVKAADDRFKAADDRLKEVIAKIASAGVKETDPIKALQQIVASRDDADKTLGAAIKKLEEGKYLAPNAARADVVRGIADAIVAAKTVDPAGKMASVQRDVQRLEAVVSQRWTPQEMLSVWRLALQGPDRMNVAKSAALDAERVIADAKATPEAKAEAQSVQAYLLVIEGKYPEARALFKKAVDGAGPTSPWRPQAERALQQLSDPAVAYLPQVEVLLAAGRYSEAQELLAQAEKVQFPKDAGRVLVWNSHVKLSLARSKAKGKLTAEDAAPALKDAEAAIKAGAVAEGHFAAGRVLEEVGRLAAAEQHYRQALKADPASASYKLALARILVQPRTRPAETKTSQLEPGKARTEGHTALTALVMLLAGEDSGDTPWVELKEAKKLAEQVIQAGNAEGYLVLARVNANEGEWSKALQNYSAGLKHLIRPDYAEGLSWVVDNHPLMKMAESRQPPDPLLAEQYYNNGLRFYQAGKFEEAEKEFTRAVLNSGLDARFRYYLGLSQLPQQGKRDLALESFRVGARTEEQGQPSRSQINAALERVQGDARTTLNRFRP